MIKTARKKITESRSGWLKLLLELIVVFFGVSAGFLFDNFREEQSNRKPEEKYLESFYDNVLADSAEIREMIQNDQNNTDISRSAVVSMQEGTFTMDSLDNDLKNSLAAAIEKQYADPNENQILSFTLNNA